MTDTVALDTDTNLFGDEITAVSGADISRDALALALHTQLKDISVPQFAALLTNRFDAVVEYANLCAGERSGQRISLMFNPHRLDTGTKRFPISLYQALKDPGFVRGLARVVLLNKKKGNTKDLLYASIGMGVQGTSYVQEFPPHVARDLAKEYGLNKHCHVLDPCAGWGGRMLGFSAVVNSYTCCEPSTKTVAGLTQLLAFIQSFRSTFNATIHPSPFEDVTLPAETFDFAMTSPPYYDTEWYAPGEQTSSGNRYATFDAWCAGFYAPLIHRTMRALKPGGVFIINIGSRLYPLNERLAAIADGKYDVCKQKDRLSASNGLGKQGEGETFYEVKKSGTLVLPEDLPVELVTPERVSDVTDDAETSEPGDSDVSFDPTTLDAVDVIEPAPRIVEPAVPSALDFINSQSFDTTVQELHVNINAPVINTDLLKMIAQQASETLERVVPKLTPADVIARLAANEHAIYDKRGKLMVTKSSTLTDEERDLLREHRDALLVMVPPFPEVDETPKATSLIQFLGEQPVPRETWRREDPPILDNVNDLEIDFETNGLEWLNGKDKPIGAAVRWNGRSKYFPWGHQGSPDNLDENVMRRWFNEQVKRKRITNANIKFDIHMSREWGADLTELGCEFSDVMHYAALLDDHRKRFALNELAKDFLGREKAGMDLDPTRMAHYTPAEVAVRAEGDVNTVAELKAAMWPLLDEQELQKVRALEDAVIPIVCEMEKNGAPLDMELFKRMSDASEAHYFRLIKEISSEAGFTFDDSAQSWQRLFERFALAVPEFKAKRPKDALLARMTHPTVVKARFAAQLDSLRSKVFNAYPSVIDHNGILRFELHQLRIDDDKGKRGTVSGRFSAPYIQQVPNHDNHTRDFGDDYFPRELYIAGSGLFLAGDAAQIEYRLFASRAQNKRVLDAYKKKPDMNFHKFMYAIMQPRKPDLSYSGMKNFNFMRIYGGGIVKTAVMMGFITEDEGNQITAAETQSSDPRLAPAREVDAIYAREMPEVKPLLRRAMHLAMSSCNKWCNPADELHRKFKHRGYVKTMLGRRSRFPNDFKIHKALNAVIQGSAADIMKTKLVELYKMRKELGFTMRMTIHDEICGDVPDVETANKISALLNEQSFDLAVPILWEVGTGKSWAEAK
jgi:DNA polymerase I-like protein with 3'-5' exonuclease and polymerase domains/SAM-dependent methyltransferase